jgi:hypothetical protein
MRVGGQRHAPAAFPLRQTRYPMTSRSGRAWKISPPPVFDPRTVKSVMSHYTDYTITAVRCIINKQVKNKVLFLFVLEYWFSHELGWLITLYGISKNDTLSHYSVADGIFLHSNPRPGLVDRLNFVARNSYSLFGCLPLRGSKQNTIFRTNCISHY